jgi:Zn-finger nucleic acid-binding protein
MPTTLEERLTACECHQCRGRWLEAQPYETWLNWQGELLSSGEAEVSRNGAPPAVKDTREAKLCPHCQRIMTRCKVGRGLNFYLDRCSHCFGVWLDCYEWETLKYYDLHVALHNIFSDPWQRQVRAEEQMSERDRHYEALFGADTFAEAKRFKQWLDRNPHRIELLTYLNKLDA